MWLQLDTDLLDSPRWLNLSLPARLWYVSMLAHCIETGSSNLDRAEWGSTRAMRSKLALLPDEYPDATAESLLEELSSKATHLVDLTDAEVVIHGFAERYTEICKRRTKDAARQRSRRERVSRGRHADVTRTSEPVTRTSGKIHATDVDVDVDGGAAPRAPAPPSTGNGGKTTATAGIAHVCADGNVNGGNGNGKRKPKLSPQQAKVKQLLGAWRKQPNEFLRWDDLLAEALAKCDEPIYLAHVIDVDQCALCVERKPAALWARFHPPDDDPDRKPIIPSDAAMLEAKRILDADLEKIAGQLAVDIGKSAKLRPPARKRKETN